MIEKIKLNQSFLIKIIFVLFDIYENVAIATNQSGQFKSILF